MQVAPAVVSALRAMTKASADSGLEKPLTELIKVRASQLNGCGFCVDAHAKELAAAGEPAVRINLVAAWRESTVFATAEKAALALAEASADLLASI